jgi:hypothetical protein
MQPEGRLAQPGRRRRSVVILVLLSGFVTALAALLFAPVLEHTRRLSPDGHFEVVVRTRPIDLFVPVMPGAVSDQPARTTLYKDGRSCGSAALPMASFVYDLRWDFDARPRRADIKFGGSWNLDDCSVRE